MAKTATSAVGMQISSRCTSAYDLSFPGKCSLRCHERTRKMEFCNRVSMTTMSAPSHQAQLRDPPRILMRTAAEVVCGVISGAVVARIIVRRLHWEGRALQGLLGRTSHINSPANCTEKSSVCLFVLFCDRFSTMNALRSPMPWLTSLLMIRSR